MMVEAAPHRDLPALTWSPLSRKLSMVELVIRGCSVLAGQVWPMRFVHRG